VTILSRDYATVIPNCYYK